jgi:DNA-binding IclR family transcriptional regulator
VDLSPSTASRLLTTLSSKGFTSRDATGHFRFGPVLRRLALLAWQEEPLYELAGPHLVSLAEETGETANIAIPSDSDRVLYLRQHASPQLVRTGTWTGRSVPRRGTALGAALDGHLLEGGYAIARNSVEPDVVAVAAPVVDASGVAVAALSVIAPSYRTSDEDLHRYGRALVAHARALAQAADCGVGGVPPTPKIEALS